VDNSFVRRGVRYIPTIDLQGHRAGTLTYIRPTDSRDHGQVLWEAVCDCGREHLVRTGQRNRVIRCDCHVPDEKAGENYYIACKKATPHVGATFGDLTLIKVLPEKVRGCYVWLMRCICGTEIKANSQRVKRGSKKNCGCKRSKKGKQKNQINRKIATYKVAARKRGISWSISNELAKTTMLGDCDYCGSPPKEDSYGICNGIDRVDNNLGYIEENIVPCCRECNWMKGTLSVEEFIRHLQQILLHYYTNKAIA
jgi:hypothetical protein